MLIAKNVLRRNTLARDPRFIRVLNPIWSYQNGRPLTQWYGHVHIVGRRAIGQWFSVDLDSGEEQWSTPGGRPNTIRGVDAGVIIASETRSDGPWTLDFGVYGRSLETGEILWTAHRSGWAGHALAVLDRIPGFTNGLRDAPIFVRDGRCYCRSGRVLEVTTGEQVGTHQEVWQPDTSPARHLYDHGNVGVADGSLSVKTKNDELAISFVREGAEVYTSTFAGVSGNYFSYRLAGRSLMIIHRDAKGAQLVIKDIGRGDVITSAQLTLDATREARIESVSATHLLISIDRKDLWAFSLASLPSYRQ